jgi:hypothetical protein
LAGFTPQESRKNGALRDRKDRRGFAAAGWVSQRGHVDPSPGLKWRLSKRIPSCDAGNTAGGPRAPGPVAAGDESPGSLLLESGNSE